MKTRDITFVALMVGIICVSSQLSLSLGPIPFTLQTTAILMSGLLLGGKKAILANLIYVLIGAIGLPVFANFKGGISVIFLQTGGFIMSFPIMAYITGKFSEKSKGRLLKYLGCFFGVIINFTVGCLYFMFITEMDLIMSLGYTVFPFVITTVIQIILAIEISEQIKRRIKT